MDNELKPMDAEQLREHAHKMVDFIADYYKNIEDFPVLSQVEPGYLQNLLPESAPLNPESLQSVLDDVQKKIFPGVTHWQSPNYFAYYPSNSSIAGFLGEMLSAAFNVIGFSWVTSPAATELEMIVLDWLAKLLKLPDDFLSSGNGGGVIQGTASEAVLVVLLAARDRALRRFGKDYLKKLVVYASDQTHSALQKACQIGGIHPENCRWLKADISTNYALSPDVLSEELSRDTARGLIPFFLCATVGTTSSTAVDPLPELGTIAKRHEMWFHVDAAYAGSACVCPEYRQYIDGVEEADSFNMNLHKWFLTNFDCSAPRSKRDRRDSHRRRRWDRRRCGRCHGKVVPPALEDAGGHNGPILGVIHAAQWSKSPCTPSLSGAWPTRHHPIISSPSLSSLMCHPMSSCRTLLVSRTSPRCCYPPIMDNHKFCQSTHHCPLILYNNHTSVVPGLTKSITNQGLKLMSLWRIPNQPTC